MRAPDADDRARDHLALMPPGVEHSEGAIFDVTASWDHLALMPPGVEHVSRAMLMTLANKDHLALMPPGVEHSMATNYSSKLRGPPRLDAARR